MHLLTHDIRVCFPPLDRVRGRRRLTHPIWRARARIQWKVNMHGFATRRLDGGWLWYGATAAREGKRQQWQLATVSAGTVNWRLQLSELPDWRGGDSNDFGEGGNWLYCWCHVLWRLRNTWPCEMCEIYVALHGFWYKKNKGVITHLLRVITPRREEINRFGNCSISSSRSTRCAWESQLIVFFFDLRLWLTNSN